MKNGKNTLNIGNVMTRILIVAKILHSELQQSFAPLYGLIRTA